MKHVLPPHPSLLLHNVKPVSALAADARSRGRLRRDMVRVNLLRSHRGWSRVARRIMGRSRVSVKLDLSEASSFAYRAGTSDLMVLEEIFVRDEYAYPELEGERIEYILDIGSNIGISALFWAERFPRARLVCVEPEAGNFELLQENTRALCDRAVLLRAAAAGSCGEHTLHRAKLDWAHRTEPRAEGAFGAADTVRGLTVDAICEQAGFPRVDLMKMDIEGGEADILPTLRAWRYRPRFLAVEPHPPYSFEDLARDLAGGGYTLSPDPRGSPRRHAPLAVRDA